MSHFTGEGDKQKEQSLNAERLNYRERQDGLQGFICKIPVILYELSASRANLTKQNY